MATEFNGFFPLANAGHHFLFDVVPLRDPESRLALSAFVNAARRLNPSILDLDFILIRCLEVLNNHVRAMVPSPVEQYLHEPTAHDNLTRFATCVERVLRHHCIRDNAVHQAVELVSSHFASSYCTPRLIAEQIGVRLQTLDVLFGKHVGCTLGEYIRSVRLQHACTLLARSHTSIKEVWASLGYSHHSNFDHDFKRKFNCTPREYRQRVIMPGAPPLPRNGEVATSKPVPPRGTPGGGTQVLLVDDDEYTTMTIARALSTLSLSTVVAVSGSQGLDIAVQMRPSVVLVEYRLRDMNGIEFLRLLREKAGDHRPAVALFSAAREIFDLVAEVRGLNVSIASKLCTLTDVEELVLHLRTQSTGAHAASQSQLTRRRNRWMIANCDRPA